MDFFKYSEVVSSLDNAALSALKEKFKETEEISRYNSEKVLSAFQKAGVSAANLQGSDGYGYDDRGREMCDRVYALAFGAEDALVRHTFASGTHTLSIALWGVLRPGDRMVSVCGTPYDTMREVIGISGEKGKGNLFDFGITYDEVPLKDGEVDIDLSAKKAVGAKMIYIQRSRGYELRPSLTIDKIEEIIKAVKKANPSVLVMVDNCYGEFTETLEPTDVGADLMAGSLIKNPGGSIAETGGYIAGRHDLVEMCADRLTVIGQGKEVGCTLNQTKRILQGFFLAPKIVEGAVKTADYASCIFSKAGYECYPSYTAKRADIVTSIKLGSREKLIKFCGGIQSGSPIDSFVSPEPWAMPGYDDEVIMAAGAFNLGSSIELSADGPLREPFAAFVQGGVTFETGRIGILNALQNLID
jgi:cystathionine beta-lyase family protein involved in aluminum resistance